MKNILKDNVQMKAVAVIFAFFMWIYVMAEVDPIVIRDIDNVPVTIQNSEVLESLELIPEYGSELDVRISLRARRSVLTQTVTRGIRATGVIENPVEGENIVNVDIVIDPNIEYTILPANLRINLERKMVVRKNIQIEPVGELASASMEVSEINLNPSFLYVEGPRSLVNRVTGLYAELDVAGQDKDFSKRIQVVPVDEQGGVVEGVTVSEESVIAHASIIDTKTVPIRFMLNEENANGATLTGYTLEPSEILIKGKPGVIAEVNEISTVGVNLENLVQNPEFTAQLVIPEGVQTEISEIRVISTTEILIIKEFNISKDRITFRGNGQIPNISENEEVPDIINVKVTITSELEEDFTEEDIALFIEMQDYQNNPASVPVRAEAQKPTVSIEITPLELDLEG
ncbi:YbbR domain-containing protein [Acetoanaerobium pronyense]|uniref:YbbR domain-containing protein n=1 Tax=Acetoanaerobium pronyense TaxID=1482736 RepID=A0ABS4KLZ4_9FIRM|nr:CdaR family protein [Acetoanaerobium pronyense]MBP2028810.1 YbbR domain-containing protein [Acetoanaerobium pronyense]